MITPGNKIRRKELLLAATSGLLLTVSFPKPGLDWIAWVALVPLLAAIREMSPWNSARLGMLAGWVHFMTLMYWLVQTMIRYGGLPPVVAVCILALFAAYLSAYVALFSAALTRLAAGPLFCLALVPAGWVSVEYLRALLFTGFPWELLGYSQYKRLPLIQLADITGVYGLSFLIALANASVFMAFLAFSRTCWQGRSVTGRQAMGAIFLLGAVFGAAWLYGDARIAAVDRRAAGAETVRVAVVQGNIDQARKWDPAFQQATVSKYIRHSLALKRDPVDLIVWPETATPFHFLYHARLSQQVQRGVRQTGTSFLIGSPSFVSSDGRIDYFNSAYLIDPTGRVVAKHNKVHLVPFGEYVPLKRWLPFLGKMVANVGDFKPGDRGHAVTWGRHRIGTLICFEMIFPELSRAMTGNGASVLANMTNDAWFGESSGPYQHFSMAIFRAVENRRSLIRSANTGISGFIDPAGRILAKTPLCAEAVVTHKIPLNRQKTVYTRYGDRFAQGCLMAILIVVIAVFRRPKAPENIAPTGPSL